ncbi:MAG: chorismate-binding protein [Bryobacteraceae bacterium]
MWSDRQPVKLEIANPRSISYRAGRALIRTSDAEVVVEGHAFDIFEAFYNSCPEGRLQGFLAYDLAAELEDIGPLPPDTSEFPQLYFRWEPRATARGWSSDEINVNERGASSVTTNLERSQFEAAVARIVATIHAGDIFQTNLCRCIEAPCEPGTEWDLYQRLRTINPARYENFLRIDDHRTLFSISPELFLKVDNRVVTSEPIKGTRPRGATPAEDEALIRELLASVKDRAELAMIVDVVRNDLSRVCEVGSVKVTEHAQLMTLPTVHHSYSTVQGHLRTDAGPIDLLRAAFPAASISGAPKIEAMRVAMREEGCRRGPCMGAIGWLDTNGDMEFSVAIRTAFTENGIVRYYAGCGITADSIPSDEFDESGHKAAAFLRALS